MACQFVSPDDLTEFYSIALSSSQSIPSFQSPDQPIELVSKESNSSGQSYANPILLAQQSSDFGDYDPGNKIKLPRGGCVINTKIGPIQFSMVPETVKDHLNLGLEVPTIFIMPTYRFDKRFCLSVAEFEFPAYFNFFVKRRKVILICDKEGEEAIRTIFQETLLGPADLSDFDQDFVMDYKGKPDIVKELKHFAKNPFNPTEPLTVDTLINFVLYKDDMVDLGSGIQVKKESQKISIYDDGRLVARIKDKADIMIDSENASEYVKYGLFANPTLEKQTSTQFIEKYIEQQFNPPVFGITILGCSHGFDPKGSTSGYIVWVNGRGIMVDPPPYSTLLLRKMGIPTSFVKWIYVSHTHADHDAGTFQKILESEKIELITTKTIMKSFVRKYAAMTGFQADYIKTLFNFRPAVVGHILRINGAEMKVHYSLHSIPCLGFTIKLLDKSIFFSGDTFYDPEGLKKMFDNGVLTEERYLDLINPEKWNNSLILHESGVPPIHTPSKVLAQLPEDVKSRIRLCHVAAKDVVPDSGLQISSTGLENTVVLIKDTDNEKLRIIRSLNLIQNIHLFQKASFKHIRDIFEVVYEKSFKKNDFICREGEKGDEFYIIRKGSVMIKSEKSDHSFVRYLYEGDYFGEACFFDKFLRTANAIAMTDDTILMILQKDDFVFIFANKEDTQVESKGQEKKSLMDQLMVLQQSRNKSLSLIAKNKFFSQLTSSQKQEFELLMPKARFFKKGSQVWTQGVHAEFAVMVQSGQVRIIVEGHVKLQQEGTNSPIKIQRSELKKHKQRRSVPDVRLQGMKQQLKVQSKESEDQKVTRNEKIYTLGEGVFICEVETIMYGKKLITNLETIEDCQLVLIPGDSLNSFLSSNPGLQVLFRECLIIE